MAKENPQIPILKDRVYEIQSQIDKEKISIFTVMQNLSCQKCQYQQHLLEKELADKLLASAMVALEGAKNEAQRKQLYLERVVEPNLPDYPNEPRRGKIILTVFLMGMVIWGISLMLAAGISEHQD